MMPPTRHASVGKVEDQCQRQQRHCADRPAGIVVHEVMHRRQDRAGAAKAVSQRQEIGEHERTDHRETTWPRKWRGERGHSRRECTQNSCEGRSCAKRLGAPADRTRESLCHRIGITGEIRPMRQSRDSVMASFYLKQRLAAIGEYPISRDGVRRAVFNRALSAIRSGHTTEGENQKIIEFGQAVKLALCLGHFSDQPLNSRNELLVIRRV